MALVAELAALTGAWLGPALGFYAIEASWALPLSVTGWALLLGGLYAWILPTTRGFAATARLSVVAALLMLLTISLIWFAGALVAVNHRLCDPSAPLLAAGCMAVPYYALGLAAARHPRLSALLYPAAVAAAIIVYVLFEWFAPGSGSCGD